MNLIIRLRVVVILLLLFALLILWTSCTKDRELTDLHPPTVGEESVLTYWNLNSSTTPIQLITSNYVVNSSVLSYYEMTNKLDYCNGASVSCFEEVNDGNEMNLS